MSRPESGGRGVYSGPGMLIRSGVRIAILDCTNTLGSARRLGRHFQGVFWVRVTRAEALGYGLEPLRGKIGQTAEVKVFALPNPELRISPHLPKHLSRFCQKRLHDRIQVVAAARQLDIG